MRYKYNWHTIEKDHDGWTVYGHGEYPRDSVLAGQYMRGAVCYYDSLEQAQAEYPNAEVVAENETTKLPSWWFSMSDCPPSDFDPDYCGERWDDDY